MPQPGGTFAAVLPKQGQLFQEDAPALVLCKPKLMPLKSVTLEKLEKMQKDAQETVKQQEAEAAAEAASMYGGGGGLWRLEWSCIGVKEHVDGSVRDCSNSSGVTAVLR